MSEEAGGAEFVQPQVPQLLEYSVRYGKAVSPAKLSTAVELAQQPAVKGVHLHAIDILEMAGHNFSNAPRGFRMIPLDAVPVDVEITPVPSTRRNAEMWRVRIRAVYAGEEAEIVWAVYYYPALNVFTVEPDVEWLFGRPPRRVEEREPTPQQKRRRPGDGESTGSAP